MSAAEFLHWFFVGIGIGLACITLGVRITVTRVERPWWQRFHR